MLRGILHKRTQGAIVAGGARPRRSPPTAPPTAPPMAARWLLTWPHCWGLAPNTAGAAGHGVTLDCSAGYAPPRPQQEALDDAALRFVDGDDVFGDERYALALLRCLQGAPGDRAKWFEDVRECRRRQRLESLARTPSAGGSSPSRTIAVV